MKQFSYRYIYSLVLLITSIVIVYLFRARTDNGAKRFDESGQTLSNAAQIKQFVPQFQYKTSTIQDETIVHRSHINDIKVDHEKEIVFGQSGSFSGHFKAYGAFIRHGILACFNKVNEEGGINGKTLRLISIEDYGDPGQSEKNIRALKQTHGIELCLGNMGTRNLLKALPLIQKEEVAILFPWGGDSSLHNKNLTHLVSGLGDGKPQVEELIRYVTQDLKMSKIGIFHSDSVFDKNNAQYAVKLLSERGLKPIAIGEFSRLAMNIEHANKQLLKGDPQVVICMCLGLPAVKLINSFLEEGVYGTQFLGTDSSFLVADMLRSKGVKFSYISLIPDPYTKDLELACNYRADLAKYYPDDKPNTLSFAYYLHAALICDALKALKGPITKRKLISQIEQRKSPLAGFNIAFNPATRHAYPYTINLVKTYTQMTAH